MRRLLMLVPLLWVAGCLQSGVDHYLRGLDEQYPDYTHHLQDADGDGEPDRVIAVPTQPATQPTDPQPVVVPGSEAIVDAARQADESIARGVRDALGGLLGDLMPYLLAVLLVAGGGGAYGLYRAKRKPPK